MINGDFWLGAVECCVADLDHGGCIPYQFIGITKRRIHVVGERVI